MVRGDLTGSLHTPRLKGEAAAAAAAPEEVKNAIAAL